jgi:uncharacterized protein
MNESLVIHGAPSDLAGFIGVTQTGVSALLASSYADFEKGAPGASQFLTSAVKGFFDNGGRRCYVVRAPANNLSGALDALSKEKISLLACPDQNDFPNAAELLVAHCEKLADRLCVLHASDPVVASATYQAPVHSSFATYYHPWVEVLDAHGGQSRVPPDGHAVGALAKTTVTQVGAQIRTALAGIVGLSQTLTPAESDELSAHGVNVLRFFSGEGNLIWGQRTTAIEPEWKYIGVRRLSIYVEQSISTGLQWVVFEPNGPPLWAKVRETIQAFLLQNWRAGAFQGAKAEEAFFVHCDASTMTTSDLTSGHLVVVIGIAPLKPAEFVILRISQWVKPPK